MTRQNILPWKSAGFTRENNPPNLLARKTCHFNSQLACQRSPLPRSKPLRQDMARQPSPPHPRLRQRSGGRGQGAGPAHPCILNRYFPFFSHLMNGYIFLYNTIHTVHILHRADWIKYKYIAVGEEIIARRGWGAGLLPAPLKGMFCIIWLLQEVSRLAILTRIGYENIYNIPL